MKVCGRFGFFRGLAMALVLGLSLALFGGNAVFAGDTPDYRIQLSPAKISLDLDPGTTTTKTFEVQNTGAKEFSFNLSVSPYTVVNEAYTETDFEKETRYTDIAKWITFSKTKGTLAAGKGMEITLTVKVPKDVPAGGQYAVVLAEMEKSADAGNGSTGVDILQRVGMVVYSNVNGQTRRGGKVLENKVPKFLFQPPISATSLIENTGNTHVDAKYILQVFPLFGDEEIYTNEENPETHIILPETRRYNTVSWEGSPHLGIFRVRQTVKIYEETSVTEKLVVICPVWFLTIIVLLLFCVAFWIVSRVRGRKKEEA